MAKTEIISKDVAKNIFEEEEDIRSFWLFFTKRVEENLANLSQTYQIALKQEGEEEDNEGEACELKVAREMARNHGPNRKREKAKDNRG